MFNYILLALCAHFTNNCISGVRFTHLYYFSCLLFTPSHLCAIILFLLSYIHSFYFFFFSHYCYPQKTCPNCGSIEVPYPLSTNPNYGDQNYRLRCDTQSQRLYFDTMNGSSYLVPRSMASFQRMVVQPSPWVSGACVAQDMLMSEGLWLNQTLPFNVTLSNTFNCSPKLLVSPLNCTPSLSQLLGRALNMLKTSDHFSVPAVTTSTNIPLDDELQCRSCRL